MTKSNYLQLKTSAIKQELLEWERVAYDKGYLKGQQDKTQDILEMINNFNFGYDYNRDCMIKERLIKELEGEKQ
jgi:hypothetical protein